MRDWNNNDQIYIDDHLYFPTEEEIKKECEAAHERGFTLEEYLMCLDNWIFREQEQEQFVEELRKNKKIRGFKKYPPHFDKNAGDNHFIV